MADLHATIREHGVRKTFEACLDVMAEGQPGRRGFVFSPGAKERIAEAMHVRLIGRLWF